MGFCTEERVGSLLTCLGAVSGKHSSITIEEVVGIPGEKVNLAAVGQVRRSTARHKVNFCRTLLTPNLVTKIKEDTAGLSSFTTLVRCFGALTRRVGVASLLRRIVRGAKCVRDLRGRSGRRTGAEGRGVSRLVDGTTACRRDYRSGSRGTALDKFLRRITLITSVSDLSRSRRCIILVALRDTGKLRFPHICLTKVRSKLFPKCVDVGTKSERRLRRRQELYCIKVAETRRRLALADTHEEVIRNRARCGPVSEFIGRVPERLLSAKGGGFARRARVPTRRGACTHTERTFETRTFKKAFNKVAPTGGRKANGPLAKGRTLTSLRGNDRLTTNKGNPLKCRTKSHIHRIGFKRKAMASVGRNKQSRRIAVRFSDIKAHGVFTGFTGLMGM